MADILIFDQLNRNLWTFALTLFLVCALIFLNRAYKSKKNEERYFCFGFFLIFLGLTLLRFFFFISDYLATGHYVGHEYYGFYDVSNQTYLNLVSVGYLAFFISITLALVMFESILKNTKYFFSFLSFLALMTFLLMPIAYKVALRYFLVFINGAVLFVILIRFYRQPDKKYKRFVKVILVSLGFYLVGSLIDTEMLKELAGSPSFPIIFFIVSASLGLSTMVMNLDSVNN